MTDKRELLIRDEDYPAWQPLDVTSLTDEEIEQLRESLKPSETMLITPKQLFEVE